MVQREYLFGNNIFSFLQQRCYSELWSRGIELSGEIYGHIFSLDDILRITFKSKMVGIEAGFL